MKKIMFNDKYLLTQEVLKGRKTQTRRILLPHTVRELRNGNDYQGVIRLYSKYKVGEVVAVAQRYKDIALDVPVELAAELIKQPGWTNKMFTKADVLTHHIRITKIRIERLQDINPMDCLAEGICPSDQREDLSCVAPINDDKCGDLEYNHPIFGKGPWHLHPNAKAAYADLIDHISGKGTWASNPYVFVYDFELIK
mgnify:CR=1 FL=1